MKVGRLILIPTPIDDDSPLETLAHRHLSNMPKDSMLLVEEEKNCRRRWLNWQLPRESIDLFTLYNEHTQEKLNPEIIKVLKKGKVVYLMSDCGLPAFCDPGQKLVDLCHKNKIQVTSTPFANSIALAMALSGFDHSEFFFAGFLPHKNRQEKLQEILKRKETVVLMDTPYRLEKLITELDDLDCSREAFLAMDLNTIDEQLERGKIKFLRRKWGKREFILILK